MAVRVLVNAVSARLGGGGTYAREQVRALGKREELDVTVIATGPVAAEMERTCPGVQVLARKPQNVVRRMLWEQLAIPAMSRRYDVLYNCGNFAVFAARCPQVVVFQNPNHFGRRAKAVARRFASPGYQLRLRIERVLAVRSLKRADAVVAISQALKATMAEESEREATVVFSATPNIEDGGDDAVAAGVPDPYVLAVGHDYPHKDWDGLIEAFLQHRDLPPLLLVGGARSDRRRRHLDARIRAAGDPPRVVLWGAEADRRRIKAFYSGASAFIAHSFLEAAALTPYEAVASGLPVVLSDIPPHHEFTPDAEFYDPDDSNDLATAVRRALVGGPPRTRNPRTWDDNAAEMAQLFTALASRG